MCTNVCGMVVYLEKLHYVVYLQAFEAPLAGLVEGGKLLERQRDDLINQYEKDVKQARERNQQSNSPYLLSIIMK